MCLRDKPPANTPAFETQQQAAAWMDDQMDAMDESCVDNYRFAFNDDREAILRYNAAQNDGCCGFFDREVLVAGRLATIGCNYGH